MENTVQAAGPGNAPLQVLLVDDQALVGITVRRLLADAPDLQLHYCANPSEALQMASDLRPFVILQDLVMPAVDGLDLVRQYRAEVSLAHVPVIVLSSREEPAVKSEAFSAGANDYLVKLPDKIELVARLRYHARACLSVLQRDEAFKALRESEAQLRESNQLLTAVNLQLEEANRRISEMARTDSLTGLANRRVLEEEIAHWASHASRKGEPLGLVLLDLDHFKSVNDRYGHSAGDSVLKAVAKLLTGHVRTYDLVARYGGEEFVVLLPETAASDVVIVADRIRRQMRELQVADFPHPVTASFGVAALLPGQPSELLFNRADVALYRAKALGRDRVEVEFGEQDGAADQGSSAEM